MLDRFDRVLRFQPGWSAEEGAAFQIVTKRIGDSKARAMFRVVEHRFCVFDDAEFCGEEGRASKSSSGWGQRGGQPLSAEDVHHALCAQGTAQLDRTSSADLGSTCVVHGTVFSRYLLAF